MITTTCNHIKNYKPCYAGWRRLLKELGEDFPRDKAFPLAIVLKSNGLDDTLWVATTLEANADRQKLRYLGVQLTQRAAILSLFGDVHFLRALRLALNVSLKKIPTAAETRSLKRYRTLIRKRVHQISVEGNHENNKLYHFFRAFSLLMDIILDDWRQFTVYIQIMNIISEIEQLVSDPEKEKLVIRELVRQWVDDELKL